MKTGSTSKPHYVINKDKYLIVKLTKWIIPLLVLLVLTVSCGGSTGTSDTSPSPTETLTTSSSPVATSPTPTSSDEIQPTDEQPDSEPLVAFTPMGSGWHNYFTFEIVDNRLLYQAIRYDYYPLDSDSINNIKPGDYIAYVGNLFGSSNDCFLVYVSNGKLYYKVIDPYAIPGPDPERCSMGTIHEGILEGYATSIAANYVRFTYWGKYGVHVNWTDDYGKGHYVIIDQWDGVTEKGYSTADDRPQLVDPIARGRMVRPSDYLEDWKQKQESSADTIVNWVKEDDNHVELKFDPTGGTVTGSFWFRHSMNFSWQNADPDHPTTTIIMLQIGDLTGTYSRGETGSFEGDVTGTRTGAFNGHVSEVANCIIDGTWTAEMDADGHITGLLHYTVICGENTYEDWFDFEATLLE
jgi:hypothetical protein